jgi:carboxyl-terminal processing protease
MGTRHARVLAGLLCAGLLAARTSHAQGRDGGVADGGTDTYAQLELFARVLSYVENNYVDEVDSRALIQGALRGMVDTLDPHTVYVPPELFRALKADSAGEFGGLGLELARKDEALVVVAPLDDSPAARAGVMPGDVLVSIDGEPTQGMEVSRAAQRLRGRVGEKVRLGLMRPGFAEPREFVLVRDVIRVAGLEARLHGKLGHVRIRNFHDRTDAQLQRALERLRAENGGQPPEGLVLDLRNNPGGLLDQAVAVGDRFLPGGLVVVTTRGRGSKPQAVYRSRERDTEPGYPMVVLVNAGSASASEIVAGALQDHGRAVVMGGRTFGKGSVQTLIELQDGSGLKLTVSRYYTPSGRSIQEHGITPDFALEGEGGGTREKDLRRHFPGERAPLAPDGGTGPQRLPGLRPSPVSDTVEDPVLRTALEYLQGR